jgi:hypothetical protein
MALPTSFRIVCCVLVAASAVHAQLQAGVPLQLLSLLLSLLPIAH